LKVLYRLRHFNYTAYLVGGSVRDLSIGRHPKDFDIGTSAHPSQGRKKYNKKTEAKTLQLPDKKKIKGE